jgi:hypothetical protein
MSDRKQYIESLRALIAEERASAHPDPRHVARLEAELASYEATPSIRKIETR